MYKPKFAADKFEITGKVCSYWNGREWLLTPKAVWLCARRIRKERPKDFEFHQNERFDNLFEAIISNAVETVMAFGDLWALEEKKIKLAHNYPKTRKIISDTLDSLFWLMSEQDTDKTNSGFTFNECCIGCGVDSTKVRKMILEQMGRSFPTAAREFLNKGISC